MASIENRYDLRGVTLNGDRPDARISLSYDHPSGAYAGLSGLATDIGRDGVQPLGYIGYAGFAHQTVTGVTWDFGVSDTGLTVFPLEARDASPNENFRARRYRGDYAELYGGVAWRDLSAHLYLSPNYLGQRIRTAYLDLNQGFRPADWLRFYLHGGALTPLAAFEPRSGADGERFDIGAGTIWIVPHAEIRVGWTGISRVLSYAGTTDQRQSRFVASISGFF